jgi:ribosome-binding protein aMBF1 (putative translation factor)
MPEQICCEICGRPLTGTEQHVHRYGPDKDLPRICGRCVRDAYSRWERVVREVQTCDE